MTTWSLPFRGGCQLVDNLLRLTYTWNYVFCWRVLSIPEWHDQIVSFWLVMIRLESIEQCAFLLKLIKLHHRNRIQRLNYSGLCTISIHPVHAAEMLEACRMHLRPKEKTSQLTRTSWCFSLATLRQSWMSWTVKDDDPITPLFSLQSFYFQSQSRKSRQNPRNVGFCSP